MEEFALITSQQPIGQVAAWPGSKRFSKVLSGFWQLRHNPGVRTVLIEL